MVSVIIPTYNGAQKVLDLLKCLELQSFKDFETLVVIDGSTDNTVDLLENTFFSLNSFRLITQENIGRAAVRNRGAGEAKGDILIFFDDDMKPEEGCVAAHIAFHEKHHNAVSVGSAINMLIDSDSEMQKYKCYYSREWEAKLFTESEKSLTKDNLYLTAANFSIQKATFGDLGGFDERLKDAEDYDLAVRLFAKGIPVYYTRTAAAWHMERCSYKSYVNRRKEYVAAHKLLNDLNPELYQTFNKRSVKEAGKFKSVFFWFFSFNFWGGLIENSFFSFWLPSKARFRLYDWVITSHVLYFPK